MATVMVVGSGGREMAQALALAKSAAVAKVLVAPGDSGASMRDETRRTREKRDGRYPIPQGSQSFGAESPSFALSDPASP